jgi:hypothetical protein
LEVAYHHALIGPDKLTAHYVLAPQIWGQAKEVVKVLNNRYRVLMDHELHTGIIAKQEWMSDFFSGLKGIDRTNIEATLDWQQKIALFHFFKYRLSSRTLNASGRFNPYMVVGFPGLVIQRPFYSDPSLNLTEDQILGKLQTSIEGTGITPPPQFLGMVEGIQHSIGQEGGQTSFSMSHCRSHLGSDDEFVNAVLGKVRIDETYKFRINYILDVGEISSNLNKNADALKKLEFLIGCSTPPSAPSRTDDGTTTSSFTWLDRGAPVKVPKGATIGPGHKGLYPSGIVDAVRVLDSTVTTIGERAVFSRVQVFERIDLPIGGSTVPIEEILRPRWMSDSYSNKRIGKDIYDPFFGCAAIIDHIGTKDADGREVEVAPSAPGEGTQVESGESATDLITRVTQLEQDRLFYSIEKAVNVVSYLYSQVRKDNSMDVDEFITSFVRRPIATKQDVLGSYNLNYLVGTTEMIPSTSAVEGFHSRALSPEAIDKGSLTGLIDDPASAIARMDKVKKNVMAASYDVRKAKLDRVRTYRIALDKGRGRVG